MTKVSKEQIITLLIVVVLLGMILLYEHLSNIYELSHAVIFGIFLILAVLFLYLKKIRKLWSGIINFIGLEESRYISVITGYFGGMLLSIYLLLSDSISVIPPVLQFSIIPITATLGGLVIAGANYSKITPKERKELLRVAQNFIVATIAFIFFAIIFFIANIGESINPNEFPITQLGWIKFIFYWIALILFLLGTSLFVIGIINLAIGLNNLKEPYSPSQHR